MLFTLVYCIIFLLDIFLQLFHYFHFQQRGYIIAVKRKLPMFWKQIDGQFSGNLDILPEIQVTLFPSSMFLMLDFFVLVKQGSHVILLLLVSNKALCVCVCVCVCMHSFSIISAVDRGIFQNVFNWMPGNHADMQITQRDIYSKYVFSPYGITKKWIQHDL